MANTRHKVACECNEEDEAEANPAQDGGSAPLPRFFPHAVSFPSLLLSLASYLDNMSLELPLSSYVDIPGIITFRTR